MCVLCVVRCCSMRSAWCWGQKRRSPSMDVNRRVLCHVPACLSAHRTPHTLEKAKIPVLLQNNQLLTLCFKNTSSILLSCEVDSGSFSPMFPGSFNRCELHTGVFINHSESPTETFTPIMWVTELCLPHALYKWPKVSFVDSNLWYPIQKHLFK